LDYNTLIGLILLGIILFLITYFTFLSRRRINKIKKSGPDTARKIIRDLENEK